MNEYLQALQGAVWDLHGLRSKYVESVPIVETFRGQTVWDGVVEVFSVEGHPKAKKVYAWAHREGEGDKHTRYIAVLELPPVDSPRKAVQVAIASGSAR